MSTTQLQRQRSILESSWNPRDDENIIANKRSSTARLLEPDGSQDFQPLQDEKKSKNPKQHELIQMHMSPSTVAMTSSTMMSAFGSVPIIPNSRETNTEERQYVDGDQKVDLSATGTASAAPKPAPLKEGKYDRWIILAVSCIGGLLAAIQSSALIIAFPILIANLGSSITTMLWVLLSFLLVVSAIVPVTGKLGDIFGQPMLFNFGFLFFTIASLLSGFAQVSAAGYDLVGYRVILGFGGTFLFSNSVAIITDVFAPHGQVGLAQGVFQIAFACGSVLGPVVGGGLGERDWRWIFWYNVPPSAICTILGFIFIRNRKPRVQGTIWQIWGRFDFLGALLLMSFLTLIILALTQAVLPDPNLSTTAGLTVLVVIGCACLVGFCLNERFLAVDPIIDLNIFRNKIFAISTSASVCLSFARGNVTYAMIFFYQGPFSEDPLTAGIMLIPLGLGIVLTGLLAGFLADKVGVRNLCVLGCLVSMAGVIGLAFVDRYTNYWLIAFALLVFGMGNGFFNSPNGVAGMLSVKPSERGVASGIRLCLSFLPQMVGIVITFALILNSLTYQQILILFIYGGGGLDDAAIASFMNALRIIFWITVGSLGLGAILSAFIPGSFNPLASMKAASSMKSASNASAKRDRNAPDAAVMNPPKDANANSSNDDDDSSDKQ